MREAIERVIAELEEEKKHYLLLTIENYDANNATGASFFRGKAAGLRMSIEKLRAVLSHEPTEDARER